VKWNPEWGKERMISMIRERSDWCISRQRHWGLPIPVFYCEDCKKPVCTPETIEATAELFAARGSNAWFDMDAADILPRGFKCPHCGGGHFTKETDTLDGWFDSGSTHAAVLDRRHQFPALCWPADIYLEGGYQCRGWFQSSRLTSVATRGTAPYRIVITNGWTVDGEGRAMHKSLGNGVPPEDVINEFGADILRLWAASSDYRTDMRISKDILKQLSDVYLKIRNTARYMIGNLHDFDPNELTPFSRMEELDRWALVRLNKLVSRVRASYDRYEYHTVYHGIHNFCAIEMSNFYLDIIKDRLYCDGRDSASRRSAQTAIYRILDALVRMLAPILAFTSEEIWAVMPHGAEVDAGSVLFNDMPSASPEFSFTAAEEEKWDALLSLRDDVNKALEYARADKIVGKPLDAEIALYFEDDSEYGIIRDLNLAQLFIASKVSAAVGAKDECRGVGFPGVEVLVTASKAPKCARCWTHDDHIGEHPEHPELCLRCASAVTQMAEEK